MKSLSRRLTCTFFILTIFEFGNKILLPGFLLRTYSDFLNQNALLNLFFSSFGSKITLPTIFALGMGPYMTALIVWQTITMLNENAFQKMTQRVSGTWQKFITLLFAAIQGAALGLLFMKYRPVMQTYMGINTYWRIVIILISGAMFVSWLADFNASHGIGGTSILIIPGLIQNLPNVLNSGLKKPLVLTLLQTILVVVLIIVYIYFSVLMNRAERRIPIERINVDSSISNSYIPLKILAAGAMPFMFSLSLYSIPILVTSQLKLKNDVYQVMSELFSYHTWQGIFIYSIVIILLGYGFSFVNVRPQEIAKSLQRSGDYIVDVLPGGETKKYITYKLKRVIFLGNSYLLFISIVPLIIGKWIPIATNFSFLFGSMLILITMIDNIWQEIRALFLKKQYRIFS